METITVTYPHILTGSHEEISLAIGFFDGVHRGHQAVIGEAQKTAQSSGWLPAVMTFDPHPRAVLGKAPIHRFLTPLDEKLALFKELGVKRTYVVRFDSTFASLSKEAFVDEVLVPLGVRAVSVGFNFTFGHQAKGKAHDLQELSQGRFLAKVVEPIFLANHDQEPVVVSSTRLRQSLAEGNMEMVETILGRPYAIEGTVVHGDGRGRKIGFPTANLELSQPYLIPRRGVYLVRVEMEETHGFGLMNIGVRPTFAGTQMEERLEVHLLDKSGDFYGKKLRVHFIHFLREERKFASVEELISQIQRDQKNAENWIATRTR